MVSVEYAKGPRADMTIGSILQLRIRGPRLVGGDSDEKLLKPMGVCVVVAELIIGLIWSWIT